MRQEDSDAERNLRVVTSEPDEYKRYVLMVLANVNFYRPVSKDELAVALTVAFPDEPDVMLWAALDSVLKFGSQLLREVSGKYTLIKPSFAIVKAFRFDHPAPFRRLNSFFADAAAEQLNKVLTGGEQTGLAASDLELLLADVVYYRLGEDPAAAFTLHMAINQLINGFRPMGSHGTGSVYQWCVSDREFLRQSY